MSITPEMTKAGLAALRERLLADSPTEAFASVYLAMKALDPEVQSLREGLRMSTSIGLKSALEQEHPK